MTALDARQYWENYYSKPFIHGLGTEEIIAMLDMVPEVGDWLDLGAGSESLFWGCALRARHLTAVDLDADRLALLTANARTTEARGAYRTALVLGGRAPGAWPEVCAMLTATRQADCLHGTIPGLGQAELVTQFGLLGLCADEDHFAERIAWMADRTTPGGWLAGANWMSAIHPGRIRLTERLYTNAFAHTAAELVDLRRIPSADRDYPEVWAYVARMPRTPGGGTR